MTLLFYLGGDGGTLVAPLGSILSPNALVGLLVPLLDVVVEVRVRMESTLGAAAELSLRCPAPDLH